MDCTNSMKHPSSSLIREKTIEDGIIFLPEKNNVAFAGTVTFLMCVGMWTLASFAVGKMKVVGEKNLFTEEPVYNLGVGVLFSSALTACKVFADIIRNKKVDSYIKRYEREKEATKVSASSLLSTPSP